MKCNKCNIGEMVEKNGVNGLFLACNAYPNCKNTQNVDEPMAKAIVKATVPSKPSKDASIVAQCLTKIRFRNVQEPTNQEILDTYRIFLSELD